MPDTPIDKLTVEIDAKANDANSAIDSLCKKIDILTTAISKVDVGKLNSLSSGIQRLGVATKEIQAIDKRAFTGIATKIKELSAIDTSKFATVSADLNQMANGINSLGTVSANAVSVGELAKNISKLGNKSVQTAIKNIPQLATSLKGLLSELSHAPRVSQNVIQMTNALANLTAQGSKVGSASSSIVKGLNRTSSSAAKANKSFKGLASTFGTFYANCFMVIRGLKSLWGSIEGTADYLEAFNYFEVALNKVGGDWAGDWKKYSEKLGVTSAKAYANSFKTRLNESLKGLSGVRISIDANGETGILTDTGLKNLGLNIQEVTQYASQLASVTNSVGQTGEVTLAAASAFTKLGADMSSLFNVDYSSVMNNLQSGLIGQSRALYKYGIDITNATLQTYAYELGVEKAVSEMTQAEKMQLRMIAILDQSKVAWGDQANTINSLSNSIRQFKNNIKEAGMILGQLFVPILEKVMPIVNGVTIAIKRLMVSIAGIMGIKLNLSEFGQSTSGVADEIDGISDSLDGLSESAKKAESGARSFDELNIVNLGSETSGTGSNSGISSGGIDLTEDILKATEAYETAWQEAYDRMQNRAEAFADKIEKALEPVKKIFKDFAIGDFFQAGQDVSKLVISITDFFARAIDDVDWYEIGTKIGDFIAGINWIEILSSAVHLIWQAIKASIEQLQGMFDAAPIETALIGAVAILKFSGIGKIIWGKISAEIVKNISLESIGTTLLANIKSIFGSKAATSALAFISPITKAIAGIGTIISGITIAVSNFFSMWKNGFSWLNEALVLAGTALTAFGAVILGAPALVAGVVAGIAATVSTIAIVVHDNWDSICEFTKELQKKVSALFGELKEDVVNIFTVIANIDLIKIIADIFGDIGTKVKNYFVKKFEEAGYDNDKDLKENGKAILNGLLNGILEVINNIGEWIKEHIFKPIVNGIKKAFGIHSPAREMKPLGKNIILGLIEGFIQAYSDLEEKLEEIKGEIVDNFKEAKEKASEKINELKENVSDKFENIRSIISDKVEKAKNIASIKFENISSSISQKMENAKNNVASKFESIRSSISEKTESAKNAVSNKFESIRSTVASKSENLSSKVSSAFEDVRKNISEKLEKAKISSDSFKSTVNTLTTKLSDLFGFNNKKLSFNLPTDLLKNFSNSVSSVVDKIKNLFSFSGKTVKINSSVSSYSAAGKSVPVKGYATGGFPRKSSLFYAGEGGRAELLGTVGGKTAVAGGAEITGIREEIRSTSNEEIALLKQQNNLLQAILQKEFGITQNEIGKAARNYAKDYSKRTGREAYSFS